MDNAWMIRNDGKAIPVKVHIYGDHPDEGFDIYNCMSVCEWMYSNTNHVETKENILHILALIAKSLDANADIATTLIADRISYGEEYMTREFINSIKSQLSALEDIEEDDELMEELGLRLYAELNQEFLRVRYGGMYDTERGSHEIYFRVSSVGFNWFNIIWEFVYHHKDTMSIRDVTIVRDEESTGASDFYYQSTSGDEYRHMDVNEFILSQGNPVVESVTKSLSSSLTPSSKMMNFLSEGYSISHVLDSLPMNDQRAMRMYKKLNIFESKKGF